MVWPLALYVMISPKHLHLGTTQTRLDNRMGLSVPHCERTYIVSACTALIKFWK